MKSIRNLSICLFFAFLSNSLYGIGTSQKQPVFKGNIKTLQKSRPIDSLLIQFYRPNSILTDPELFWIKPEKNGHFSFKLPYYSKPGIMSIQTVQHKRFTRLGKYFVEPEDDISLTITNKPDQISVEFKGKGASKYSIVDELKQIDKDLENVYSDLKLYEPDDFSLKFEKVNILVKQALEKKSHILNSYNLGAKMYKMVNYEYANIYSKWDYWLYSISIKPTFHEQANRLLLRNYFNENKNTFSYVADELMGFCPEFIISLSCRIRFDIIFNSNLDNVDIRDYYKLVKEKYPQSIKNQLIAWLFSSKLALSYLNSNDIVLDSLMGIGQNDVIIPFLRQSISDVQKLSKGKNLFNATFTDFAGRKVNTASLKGKVILIDMWGVGCTNCAIFHKMFEREIHPKLEGRNDFVVLSISMDRTKEKWDEGMKSGFYTSPHNLNVYTDGLMFNHPFAKYYNIGYSPFLLLIDKQGKIYSSLKSTITANDILNKINEALNSD